MVTTGNNAILPRVQLPQRTGQVLIIRPETRPYGPLNLSLCHGTFGKSLLSEVIPRNFAKFPKITSSDGPSKFAQGNGEGFLSARL